MYDVTSSGVLRFTVEKTVTLRRSHGHCPAPDTTSAPGTCVATVTVAKFHDAVAAGPGVLTFQGRINGKTLPAGSYILEVTPKSGGVVGRAMTVDFTIRQP